VEYRVGAGYKDTNKASSYYFSLLIVTYYTFEQIGVTEEAVIPFRRLFLALSLRIWMA
jgi:hypothetical protein